MIFFYQILIRLFSFSVGVASLFNKKAKLFVGGRKNIFIKLKNALSELRTPDSQLIWFHCSSLGEFEQARPLIEGIRNKVSGIRILITFFSPSGYEVRKKQEDADLVFYLPVDTASNVKKFLDIVKPSQAFFVKYDFWYNYLNQLHKRKIPSYLVSANFREEQFNGFYGAYLEKVLPFFNFIFVQNESSSKLLAGKNIHNVIVSGDLRYDRVSQSAINFKKIPLVELFKGESKLIIGGSTWPEEEAILAGSDLQRRGIKIIIAPHQVDDDHIKKIISLFPDALRYSVISKEPVSSALGKLQSAKVLIIDNIGMLSNLYRYADVAFVGGGFGAGLHNILEAIAFGVPALFGPNNSKFPEAGELITAGGAFEIAEAESFNKTTGFLFSDELILKMASMTCKNFIGQKRGAVERILEKIRSDGK